MPLAPHSKRNKANFMNPSGCDPRTARLCEECTNLVTTDTTCPLCNAPTVEHPERGEKERYCSKCGEGPFPLEIMHLITWNEDPYMQLEDGDLICECPKCKAEQDQEEAEKL